MKHLQPLRLMRQLLLAAGLMAILPFAQASVVQADIQFDRAIEIRGSLEAVQADFAARTPLLEAYPNLKEVTPLGEESFKYTLKPIGKAGVTHVTKYAASYEYTTTENKLSMDWQPVDGHGNATLTGALHFEQVDKERVRIRLKIEGQLREIEVPFLYKPVAPSVTRDLFEENAQQYLTNIAAKYWPESSQP